MGHPNDHRHHQHPHPHHHLVILKKRGGGHPAEEDNGSSRRQDSTQSHSQPGLGYFPFDLNICYLVMARKGRGYRRIIPFDLAKYSVIEHRVPPPVFDRPALA